MAFPGSPRGQLACELPVENAKRELPFVSRPNLENPPTWQWVIIQSSAFLSETISPKPFSLQAWRGERRACDISDRKLSMNSPHTAEIVWKSQISHKGGVGIVHAQPTNGDAALPLPLLPEGGVRGWPQPRLCLNYLSTHCRGRDSREGAVASLFVG